MNSQPLTPQRDSHEYAALLTNGRLEEFETIVVLDGGIRCTRDDPTPRNKLYYHIDDVEQIERIEPNER